MLEQVLASYGLAHGLKYVALRYFNAAGATEKLGELHEPESHLVPNVLAAASGAKSELVVFGNDYPTPDGTAIRDYVHVADLAQHTSWRWNICRTAEDQSSSTSVQARDIRC